MNVRIYWGFFYHQDVAECIAIFSLLSLAEAQAFFIFIFNQNRKLACLRLVSSRKATAALSPEERGNFYRIILFLRFFLKAFARFFWVEMQFECESVKPLETLLDKLDE